MKKRRKRKKENTPPLIISVVSVGWGGRWGRGSRERGHMYTYG